MVEKTYGHKPFYLFAEENGEMVGILPLFLINSHIFGRRLVSLPYSPYGGVCADGEITASTLIKEAVVSSKRLGVKFLELRNMVSIPDMPTNDKYITLILRLDRGEEAIWKSLRKGMKACVKRAAKENFNITMDSKDIKGFYTVYCRRMRDLGTPVPPLSFFSNVVSEFPNTSVAAIEYRGKVVASQVLLFFKKTAIYAWGASLKEYSSLYPTHLLLWKVIEHSCSSGFEVFDFGRSAQDSGTYQFKKWWGATPQPLFYQYYLKNTKEVPYIHASNPKYSIAIRIWRRLPLLVANRLGPIICKNIV